MNTIYLATMVMNHCTCIISDRLKALIAIPDIQPRYAIAIWKKYPCMRSLLNEYMDASKTVSAVPGFI